MEYFTSDIGSDPWQMYPEFRVDYLCPSGKVSVCKRTRWNNTLRRLRFHSVPSVSCVLLQNVARGAAVACRPVSLAGSSREVSLLRVSCNRV
ncbi:hypothetical protein PR048_001321 [Dryococelus australis]|uniref:Uncharacterized protein n=1 Tax=Dryococelus australis TaxID=614101 RepID=A0ABQ9IH11_9NEOP|nr:hypothetical protein PR048_001321 [Dryococelus australis]